jgi:hypothetical protein
VLYSLHFGRNNAHFAVSSVITYIGRVLWDFLPCRTMYDNITYRYKYGTDFTNVGITLCNIERKETITTDVLDFFAVRLPMQVMTYLSSWNRRSIRW